MTEREFKLLLEAGAVRSVLIMASGSSFYLEAKAGGLVKVLQTGRGEVRQWRTVDSCAKWLRKNGIGRAEINFENWHLGQKDLEFH